MNFLKKIFYKTKIKFKQNYYIVYNKNKKETIYFFKKKVFNLKFKKKKIIIFY